MSKPYTSAYFAASSTKKCSSVQSAEHATHLLGLAQANICKSSEVFLNLSPCASCLQHLLLNEFLWTMEWVRNLQNLIYFTQTWLRLSDRHSQTRTLLECRKLTTFAHVGSVVHNDDSPSCFVGRSVIIGVSFTMSISSITR